RAGEVRGFGRHVQTGGEAVAAERLLAAETLANRGEYRHLAVSPLDAPHPFGRECEVFHVVPFRRSHSVLSFRRPRAARACAVPSRGLTVECLPARSPLRPAAPARARA